jgi:transcriptional regulator GlxA family with amidase domain
MIGRSEQSEIGLVLYPGAQLAAVHGLTDLFGIANRFAAKAHGPAALRVSHWRMRGDRVACVYRSEPSVRPVPDILILPPTLGNYPTRTTARRS